MTKVWITKYALTQGIFEADAEECGDGMVKVRPEGSLTAYYHGEGVDWHRTHESAAERARQVRDKRVAALRRQIAKLEKKKFER